MDKVKNLSIRRTIVLYMTVVLILCFFLSAAIVKGAEILQNRIWWKYTDQEKYLSLMAGEGEAYVVDIPRPNASEMEVYDYKISEFCDFLQTYSVLVISVLGSVGAVFLFYKNKLKEPVEELTLASQKISQNRLEFHISYESQDEMGRLCREFERMREQLAQNNRKLWKTLEEERALRAAIAHDIRSPLTILKGYQEMLKEYLPGEALDMKKVMAMLEECEKQIRRMDYFIETMRKLGSLENRTFRSEKITGEELKRELQAEMEIFEKESGISCVLVSRELEEGFRGDKEVILEVAENLLSNALRYASQKIELCLSVARDEIQICLKDDGRGFQNSLEEMTKPFYQQNLKDSLKHAGLGMYISRLYCEKHGGRLVLKNGDQGGAIITAVFHRIA